MIRILNKELPPSPGEPPRVIVFVKDRIIASLQHPTHIGKAVWLTRVFKHRGIGLIVSFQLIGADPHNTLNGVKRYGVNFFFYNNQKCTIN